jgi:cobyrinic acid a,c-diamide synthase
LTTTDGTLSNFNLAIDRVKIRARNHGPLAATRFAALGIKFGNMSFSTTKSLAPGLLIAAPRSGSGKTLLTLGLLRAFKRAKLDVAGAKCGPDYIDPAFHAAATGVVSYNLDSWAMTEPLIKGLAFESTQSRDLILCEGLMGLFDGVSGPSGRNGSSADIAAMLGWPILLILDVSGQSQTAAAIVKGCTLFDQRLTIAGVVLNRVGSERHARLVTEAINEIGIKVFGALPRSTAIRMPERHLGLVQANETENLDHLLNDISDFISAHVDLAAVFAAVRPTQSANDQALALPFPLALPPPAQKIAIAHDKAFSFFYPHILVGWQKAGAEIMLFSPLADEAPPESADFCWLPGGYPELYAAQISAANNFLEGLRNFATIKPVHGECGGYMVLGRSLADANGQVYPMAGLLHLDFSFAQRKLSLGYRNARLTADGPLGQKNSRLRGHEFHYATHTKSSDAPFALVKDAHGGVEQISGSRRDKVSGSFFHVIASG